MIATVKLNGANFLFFELKINKVGLFYYSKNYPTALSANTIETLKMKTKFVKNEIVKKF